ncbi:dihydroorotate dehydrogenase (fumarate) [Myxococcaceae bacterium]|jgi:dihydroorotate dehydrogenase (fumarate)|nr:dihydroorotate dehydrogenase (fumarate) [Myxococcaceae bacterium]
MDLETPWLGLRLAHPVVASASPLSRTLDGIRRLEDGGVSAIVLHSLFEEEILHDNEATLHLSSAGSESHPESLGYFPAVGREPTGPDRYLELVRRAREAVAVPIVASLNGVTETGWTDFAKLLEEAGANALELNLFHLPVAAGWRGRAVEDRCEHVVRAVAKSVSIPVNVKLSPYFSAIGEMAERLVAAGARGLALFNRFYQPDFDLEKLEVERSLELSKPWEMRLPLLWIAVLHGRIGASLAGTSGVESRDEVVKYLLAGADVVMTTSALLRNGPAHARALVDGLRDWLEARGCRSVDDVRGSMSQRKVANPEAFERGNYLHILQEYRSPYQL